MLSQFPTFPRLSSLDESKFNIEFRELSLEESSGLRKSLENMSGVLNASIFPDLGKARVLSEPLTDEFRKHCDQKLGLQYASMIEDFERPRDEMEGRECGEKVIDLVAALNSHNIKFSVSSRPSHEACGEFAGKPRIFWVREQVATRFIKLAEAFNAIGVMVQLEDGYRPPAVQEGLFRRRYKLVKADYPSWSEDEIMKEVSAKTAISPFRAAHMAGGAIDFTMKDFNGNPLPLGNDYPIGGTSAILDFPYLTAENFYTRAIFKYGALMAGLWPYIGEDWHVSYGDGLANLWTGEKIIRYGPLKGFEPDGSLIPYPANDARNTFSVS